MSDNNNDLLVSASIRQSKKTGNLYCWSKTFSLREAQRTLGTEFATLKMLKTKKAKSGEDPDQRLIILSPSEQKYMAKNQDNVSQDGTAVFINAQMRTTKSGDSKYCWSKTFSLKDIEHQFGTEFVTVTILTPKNAKTDDDRLVIFNTSEAKFMPKDKGPQNTPQQNNTTSSGSEEVEL